MKNKFISIRVTQEEYERVTCVTKELGCNTIAELFRKCVLQNDDDVTQKLRVCYRKPIVKEILKRNNIDLDTFDWSSYKPTIEVIKP